MLTQRKKGITGEKNLKMKWKFEVMLKKISNTIIYNFCIEHFPLGQVSPQIAKKVFNT